jgi:hypothetical protein
MLYALRNDKQKQDFIDHALFYFRDPNYAETVAETNSENRAK